MRFQILDERISYVRQSVAKHDADYIATGSFAAKLAGMSMGQHLAELEAQAKERDDAIRAEMAGKPTPIYDKLKAEGFDPPATVMLVGTRPPTEAEVAYARTLEGE